MPLSWNEIRSRAIAFSKEWTSRQLPVKGAEKAEAQTFWNDFFEVFGKKRKHVAAFEAPVKNLQGNTGRIDLLWPGTMLAEHKSPGEDLDKAHTQGLTYIQNLIDAKRDNETPRYLIVSDFARIALHDLEPEQDPDAPLFKRIPPTLEFSLIDLPKTIHAFGFMAGYRTYRIKEEDPANIEAAELLANLHDTLEAGGYPKQDLDRFLVRILFCLFAEDTGIFNPTAFTDYIQNRTAQDGSDLGTRLEQLFRVLDTPAAQRQANLDDDLAELPYVNGQLFKERLDFASFNSDMRNRLLICTAFNWSRISPAIFGSLFQSIMQPVERRQIGAHYTTERDILKVIRSLFLDDLEAEFQQIKADRSNRQSSRLEAFQKKLASIHLLDPACGCGNFLILSYRELRRLEILTLLELHPSGQQEMTLDDINRLSKVDVDQLYGIEIGEWPARIAEVAIWLMDHLMNQELSTAFGQLYQRLPLKKSAAIHVGNALRLDWDDVLPAKDCTYVLGNPPFVGKKEQNAEQKQDMDNVWGDAKGSGVLDFVTAWYRRAADYIQHTQIKVAFVSTNSITQGEQVSVLWNQLLPRGVRINFAHRTFAWTSEARGKAHVHVVILGFGLGDDQNKRIYDYESDSEHPVISVASNISPYLTNAPNVVLEKRMEPLCDVPYMVFGTKLVDDGYFVLDAEERKKLIDDYPFTVGFIREYTGGDEFLNGNKRWVLWLSRATPQQIRSCPSILERVDKVRAFRAASKKGPTVELALTPAAVGEDRQPSTDYLLFPKVSSERRVYVPLGFLVHEIVANGSSLIVPNATSYHLGILSSTMHMAWMRQTCGRMKSDYQYSVTIVYNNFPWPLDATEAQKTKVEECAQAVLDARQPYLEAGQTLADLYDPLTMPAPLLKAHQALDRVVDRCYRKEAFESDRQRVEFLFNLYEQITAPMALAMQPKKRRTKKS